VLAGVQVPPEVRLLLPTAGSVHCRRRRCCLPAVPVIDCSAGSVAACLPLLLPHLPLLLLTITTTKDKTLLHADADADATPLLTPALTPQAWGDAIISVPQAEGLGNYVKQKGAGGQMLWALTKAGTPSGQQLSQAGCRTLGLGNCTVLLFS
jgi:hypothetical protein